MKPWPDPKKLQSATQVRAVEKYIHLIVKKLKKKHGNTINLICIIFLAFKDLSAVVYILFAVVYTRNERLFSVDKSSK